MPEFRQKSCASFPRLIILVPSRLRHATTSNFSTTPSIRLAFRYKKRKQHNEKKKKNQKQNKIDQFMLWKRARVWSGLLVSMTLLAAEGTDVSFRVTPPDRCDVRSRQQSCCKNN